MKFNSSFEKDLQKQVKNSPMQKELDGKVQAEVRAVNASMRGGEEDNIFAELVRRMTGLGLTPNEPNLRAIAADIAAGTMRDEA